MAKKTYNGIDYEDEIDYEGERDLAISQGDMGLANTLDQKARAKSQGEGTIYTPPKTNTLEQNLFGGNSKSSNSGVINSLLNQINNTKFEYDPNKDPLYQNYKKLAEKNAVKTSKDVLGSYAGLTGGMPSSFAVSAASQAQGDILQSADEMIPELYQLAYQKYANDKSDLYKMLSTQLDLDERDYQRKYDEMYFNYQKDRDFVADSKDAAEWNNKLSRQNVEDERYANEWKYTLDRDVIEDQRYKDEWAREDTWHKEEVDRQNRNDAYAICFDKAERGIPPTKEEMEQAGFVDMTGEQLVEKVKQYNYSVSGGGSGSASAKKIDDEDTKKYPTENMFKAIDEIIENGGNRLDVERALLHYNGDEYDLGVLKEYANGGMKPLDDDFISSYFNKLNNSRTNSRGNNLTLIRRTANGYSALNSSVVIDIIANDENLDDIQKKQLLDAFGITEEELSRYAYG